MSSADKVQSDFCFHTSGNSVTVQEVKQLKALEALYKLSELFSTQGISKHLHSDNESVLMSKSVRSMPDRLGSKTLFIEPKSLCGGMDTLDHLMLN